MAISVTGAAADLKSGVLREATLVVPATGIGALLSVTQVNNRLNRLVKVIDAAVKAADARVVRDREKVANAERIAAQANRVKSGSTFLSNNSKVSGGTFDNTSGVEGAGSHSGGSLLKEMLLGAGEFSLARKLLPALKLGAKGLPIIGTLLGTASIAYDVKTKGKVSMLGALATGAGAGGIVGGMFAGVGAIPGAVIGGALGLGSAVVYNAREQIGKSWGDMSKLVNDKAKDIRHAANSAWESATKTWHTSISYVGHELHKNWSDFKETASKYGTKIEEWIGKQGDTLGGWLHSIVDRMGQYLSTVDLKGMASEWLLQLKNWVYNKFGLGGGGGASAGGGGGGGDSPTSGGDTSVGGGGGGRSGAAPGSLPLFSPKAGSNPNRPPFKPNTGTGDTGSLPAFAPNAGGGASIMNPSAPVGRSTSGAFPNINSNYGADKSADPSIFKPGASTNLGGAYKPNGAFPNVDTRYGLREGVFPISGDKAGPKGDYPDWLTDRSKRELSQTDKDFASTLLEASKRSGIHFQVTQGMRTQSEADANARSGRGVSNSQHLYGFAGDLKVEGGRYAELGRAFEQVGKEKGFPARWLGGLGGRWGNDVVHYDFGVGYGQTHDRHPYGDMAPTIDDVKKSNEEIYNSPQNPFRRKGTSATFGTPDLAFGDSTANRLKLPGDSKDSRSPKASYEAMQGWLQTHDVKGKRVVISGMSNDTSEGGFGYVTKMAQALKDKGATVSIMGMGPGGGSGMHSIDPAWNDRLKDWTKDKDGITFTPMGETADTVHEKSAKAQIDAVSKSTFSVTESPIQVKQAPDPDADQKSSTDWQKAAISIPTTDIKPTTVGEANGEKEAAPEAKPTSVADAPPLYSTPGQHRNWMDDIPHVPIDPWLAVKARSDDH